MRVGQRELLNVDWRNKHGISITNPYGEASQSEKQGQRSGRTDPLERSKRLRSKGKGNSPLDKKSLESH